MNLTSILNGISIGKDTTGNFRLCPEGLAVRTVADGKFFVAKNEGLLDVSDLTIDGAENFVYRVPVRPNDVRKGDLIVTSENPFSVLFVDTVDSNGVLSGVDPGEQERSEHVPTTNLLIGSPLYVKVICLIDTGSFGKGKESLLPFLLLGAGSPGSNSDLVTTLLISQALRGKGMDSKLLELLLLKDGTSGSVDNLLVLSLIGGTPLSGLFDQKAADSKSGNRSKPRKRSGTRRQAKTEQSP
jgi:hypothetical protein